MRVVHIIGGGDVGGAKTHVLYLLKELGKHIEVKLISLRPGSFADDARAIGIDVSVVKSSNIFSDIKKVTQIIVDGGYDIVHSHGAKANMFSLAARRKTKLPTITTVHSDYKLDYMHSVTKRWTIGLLNSIALRFVDNYIAISRNFKSMLIDRGFNPSSIFILYNGMDFSTPLVNYSRQALVDKYHLNIDDDDIIAGIAARLYPVKSIDTLIRAAKLVTDANRKVKFLIGGDGEDRKQLEALSKSLGLTDNVFFIGWLDDPNELMSSIDISVLTSISESFPYSILEGAKFKKATISTDVGGIPDLITDGEDGYLFKSGDYQRLSELILKLSYDRSLLNLMGERIYEKAFSDFSVATMCKTQLAIYEKVLKNSAVIKSEKKHYDAIISGYYGFQNIGDDAMLMSIINDLRIIRPDFRIMILSNQPCSTAKDYDIASINRIDLLSIYRAMRKTKSFIYGGGNIIQDNTSTRSLFFYLGIVWLAKRMKLKVMFYANGIGPLRKKINRLMTKLVLNKVDVITLRERLSYEELKNLGITKPRIELTADPALIVISDRHDHSDNLLKLHGIHSEGPYLGISLRYLPGHENANHEKFEDDIARLADHMSQEHGLLPVLLPMQYPVDIKILENVAAKMKCKSVVIRDKLSFFDTYGIISRMDIVIGMRLHALIFAAGAGVPLAGLVYDEPKIEGFLEYIKQVSAGDIRKLDFEVMVRTVEDTWNRRYIIREQLENDIAILKVKSLENARIAVELIWPDNISAK
jgi:polysaccharide pyruvyl transferase CsaB